jgi:hypothetical protein
MRQRLAAGEQVARMYQEPGLAWLERQAEVAEDLGAERQAAVTRHADVVVASRRPLPCERKHRHLGTSGHASIASVTLAFAVVVCRMLPAGCRVFAACSPPAQ